MSRRDLFIDRMISQRACIDDAVAAIRNRSGHVLELGLSNGRTYHHLRERLPERAIWGLHREVAAHPESTLPPERMILGDLMETGPTTRARPGGRAVLIHADVGGHNAAKNQDFACRVSPLIERLLAPGGLMVSSDRVVYATLTELPLPEGAMPGRCFLCRR